MNQAVLKRYSLIPPYVGVFLAALMVAYHFWLPVKYLIPFPHNLWGLLFWIPGALFPVWAARTFKRSNAPIPPFTEPNVLVTDGPYRYTRNPMYLGLTLTLAGLAVLLGSLTPFLGPFLFVLAVEHYYIGPEEERMGRLFGQEFHVYRQQVNRWFGRRFQS